MLRTLTLVRHGESEGNASRRIQGQLDSVLTPLGRLQARALGQAEPDLSAGAVYASDLSRARETAELATGLPPARITLTPLLREISFGPWQGLSQEEVQERFPSQWQAFRRDPQCRPEGGESMKDLSERVSAILEHWHKAHDNQSVVAFTHGGPLRMATMVVLNLPLDRWRTLRIANSGVTRIEWRESGPILRFFNVTAHLRGVQSPGELEKLEADEE